MALCHCLLWSLWRCHSAAPFISHIFASSVITVVIVFITAAIAIVANIAIKLDQNHHAAPF